MFGHYSNLLDQYASENQIKNVEELKELFDKFNCEKKFSPFTVSKVMPNATSSNINIKYNIQGPSRTYSSACASGTIAVGEAYNAIKLGEVDMAITGATEYFEIDTGVIFRAFDAIGATTRGGSVDTVNKPFDVNRSGFLLSEGGAGVLLLEEYEHAKK